MYNTITTSILANLNFDRNPTRRVRLHGISSVFSISQSLLFDRIIFCVGQVGVKHFMPTKWIHMIAHTFVILKYLISIHRFPITFTSFTKLRRYRPNIWKSLQIKQNFAKEKMFCVSKYYIKLLYHYFVCFCTYSIDL